MVKNAKLLRKLDKQRISKEKVDVQQNYRIINALYQEAVMFGVFPLKHKKLDVDHKIRIARILNNV
ncbi:hypothetical protein A2Y85_02095 [candidate division WOR-3 bacterium RBG_13_43_14]|uniref:Uncharacterized protein n=1 Tax=candidate division WOR-3 bacterium RBG_13_43_14 TaxID=1802590 RepID=A0A1F4U8W9_UNCW3|nr:MAG: hypothetical protein A2Y85_02095 [candidate division WOR-3 bacterium RBG_13_43_14]